MLGFRLGVIYFVESLQKILDFEVAGEKKV